VPINILILGIYMLIYKMENQGSVRALCLIRGDTRYNKSTVSVIYIYIYLLDNSSRMSKYDSSSISVFFFKFRPFFCSLNSVLVNHFRDNSFMENYVRNLGFSLFPNQMNVDY